MAENIDNKVYEIVDNCFQELPTQVNSLVEELLLEKIKDKMNDRKKEHGKKFLKQDEDAYITDEEIEALTEDENALKEYIDEELDKELDADVEKMTDEDEKLSEDELCEKYVGFKKLSGKLAKKYGEKRAGAIAASIGRKKYGKKKFDKAAHEHKKMKGK